MNLNTVSDDRNNVSSNLFSYVQRLPLIDTHEHYFDFTEAEKDPICFILENYYLQTDYMSAEGVNNVDLPFLLDRTVDLLTRYEKFTQITEYLSCTGYYRAAVHTIERICGIQLTHGITYEALQKLQEYLVQRTKCNTVSVLEKANIKKIIANPDFKEFVEEKLPSIYPGCRAAFPLPPFHCFSSFEELRLLPCVESENDLLSLDLYLAAFERYFEKCIRNGIVCIKDQSAYMRSLEFGTPSREKAQNVYDTIVQCKNAKLDQQEWIPLSDWLIHNFLNIAARYNIPVQMHTGHLAFPYSDIGSANAILLTQLIQNHQDVKFILFHGNWPYMSEIMFLIKNYPNVYLDLCWVHSIDPVYSIELMKHAAVTVPWNKICGFGGDTTIPEWSVGYAEQAKENIVKALEELIAGKYMTYRQACKIAAAWLYNNPNELYGLGLTPIKESLV